MTAGEVPPPPSSLFLTDAIRLTCLPGPPHLSITPQNHRVPPSPSFSSPPSARSSLSLLPNPLTRFLPPSSFPHPLTRFLPTLFFFTGVSGSCLPLGSILPLPSPFLSSPHKQGPRPSLAASSLSPLLSSPHKQGLRTSLTATIPQPFLFLHLLSSILTLILLSAPARQAAAQPPGRLLPLRLSPQALARLLPVSFSPHPVEQAVTWRRPPSLSPLNRLPGSSPSLPPSCCCCCSTLPSTRCHEAARQAPPLSHSLS